MSQPSAAPVVERVDAHHRYEIVVDGKRAGLTEYRDHGEQRVFFHTEVGDAYAGQAWPHSWCGRRSPTRVPRGSGSCLCARTWPRS